MRPSHPGFNSEPLTAHCGALPLAHDRPALQSRRDHVKTLMGRYDLGAYGEAEAELDKVAPALRVHPFVLETRWRANQNAL